VLDSYALDLFVNCAFVFSLFILIPLIVADVINCVFFLIFLYVYLLLFSIGLSLALELTWGMIESPWV
jgi:hypothetical protein